MTPHACRAPALPVGCVVKSSAFSWMMTALPMMLSGPAQRERRVDEVDPRQAVGIRLEVAEVAGVPRRRVARRVRLGAGLKWPPAEVPSGAEQSPFSCTWKPCSP